MEAYPGRNLLRQISLLASLPRQIQVLFEAKGVAHLGPPKRKFFAWLLLQNRLWCADRLQRRGWPNSYFCLLCRRNLKTTLHLFVECPVSRLLWCEVAAWRNCSAFAAALRAEAGSIEDFLDSALTAALAGHHKGISSLFTLLCWTIWRERSSHVFQDKHTPASQLSCFIRDEGQQWTFAGAKAPRKLLWEPP